MAIVTPLKVKQGLEQLLVNELGTYTYCDSNYTTPAVSVGNPANDVTTVGLEVVVPLHPRIVGNRTCRRQFIEQDWDIMLIQKQDTTRPMVLPLAVQRMEAFFDRYWGQPLQQNNANGTFEMYRFTFRVWSLIPTLSERQILNA